MTERIRLDALVVARGLATTRARARALILAGHVRVNDVVQGKAGTAVAFDAEIGLAAPDHPYVGRGGVKLSRALDRFGIDVRGRTALDIGASTGGFTDVLLTRGARKVYAVDVGHGQLDWKLRNDPRVVVLERTNARYLSRAEIPEPPDLIVCDASFIGLRTVLPAALDLAAPGARLIALIKPQFEVGRGRVGKGGVVRDPALHAEVCDTISRWLDGLHGWSVLGIAESPIKGPEGNTEFLIGAARDD